MSAVRSVAGYVGKPISDRFSAPFGGLAARGVGDRSDKPGQFRSVLDARVLPEEKESALTLNAEPSVVCGALSG